ncbi:metallophosphoesterase family protein [Levilactobacillus acidifarinae]|uniref:Phosphoesterase or phosphohydrolase n=1 Tax=Levilactobacillus acidifarinae DSM 19394 = JCM 15949 TaxID=1423715 RepID=A0A0R1LDT5_9LACO|nr:metallophosphoesterase family protein [Levilactobacillus acidifarinae]KRK93701.1 phosphoesterase or phosphohydrolase [Levilactobacillus acidifarinae DSM 19394]GEO70688.1 metallophosphatase [Levilactobacillus acidifarinae]
MQYFTSDTHFFHKDLLGMNDFAPRPFPDVETMNQTIIDHWNARVEPTDTVYHLGDIALYFTHPAVKSDEAVADVLSQLNGHLELIKGNHDSRALFKYLAAHNPIDHGQPKYAFHDVGALIKYDHRQYYMTHYPMMLGIVHQIINLHGHIHHYAVPVKENINVGVDTPEQRYLAHPVPFGTPFSPTEIEEMVTGKAREFKDKQ